jgi:hypothetical protein
MAADLLPLDEIRRCRDDPDFRAAMENLYADLDREISAHNPPCANRGACCRFGECGHRLFVTTAELAYSLANTQGPVLHPTSIDACPYQQDGRCRARSSRPSGCRIFYCDPAAQNWQPELTERTLTRLKRLHERFGLPYAYLDWTEALRQAAAI